MPASRSATPAAYGVDRLFVRLRAHGARRRGRSATPASARSKPRAPVVEIDLPEPLALGAEFVRWEIATAVAGALLGINPFDEPNVQQAKDATNVLLDGVQGDGPPAGRRRRTATLDGIALTLTSAARTRAAGGGRRRVC